MIRVQAEPFDPAAELARFAAACPTCGAIVSFTGIVRQFGDGDQINRLELQHYSGFTEPTVVGLAEAARARFAISDVAIVHRFGDFAPGEPIVFVAAAAEHRRAAFDAVDYLMDRLKTEAPFWKREVGERDARWIEARPTDHADRSRWERTE